MSARSAWHLSEEGILDYFYDLEFLDNGYTIEWISIGIRAADGREYYRQNADFDLGRATSWLMRNVVPHLGACPNPDSFDTQEYHRLDCRTVACNSDCPWRTTLQVREELVEFLGYERDQSRLQLWGYYADYDHVALAQFFGRMIDLPAWMPKYTLDLKQWCVQMGDPTLPEQEGIEHHALADARWNQQVWEFLREYEESYLKRVVRQPVPCFSSWRSHKWLLIDK